jgi:hypothetical protein
MKAERDAKRYRHGQKVKPDLFTNNSIQNNIEACPLILAYQTING